MQIDTRSLVSITEANQNFSKVAKLVDEQGSAVILKNNTPRYLLINFDSADDDRYVSNAEVLRVGKKILNENRQAFEALAQ